MASKSGGKQKTFCVTKIPSDWPQFTGPSYTDGESVASARKKWDAFRRVASQLHPNPQVYKAKGE